MFRLAIAPAGMAAFVFGIAVPVTDLAAPGSGSVVTPFADALNVSALVAFAHDGTREAPRRAPTDEPSHVDGRRSSYPDGAIAARLGHERLEASDDVAVADPGVASDSHPGAASAAASPPASELIDAPPADRTTMASWYGPGFYGNRTACGLTYTSELRGVAHRTLPCGTVLTLTYRGHVVSAPVIDRGPFVAGRTLDLSGATRRDLGCPDLCPVSMRISR